MDGTHAPTGRSAPAPNSPIASQLHQELAEYYNALDVEQLWVKFSQETTALQQLQLECFRLQDLAIQSSKKLELMRIVLANRANRANDVNGSTGTISGINGNSGVAANAVAGRKRQSPDTLVTDDLYGLPAGKHRRTVGSSNELTLSSQNESAPSSSFNAPVTSSLNAPTSHNALSTVGTSMNAPVSSSNARDINAHVTELLQSHSFAKFHSFKIDPRKELKRKPRSMLLWNRVFDSSQATGKGTLRNGMTMNDLMVTSTLDGSVQFWDIRKRRGQGRRVLSIVDKKNIDTTWAWAENMIFADPSTVVMSANFPTIKPDDPADKKPNMQLALVYDITLSNRSNVEYSIHKFTASKPHLDKTTITSLCSNHSYFSPDADTTQVQLFSGGEDKQIIQWDLTRNRGGPWSAKTQKVHSHHTSAINGMELLNGKLWSGGMDCKLIGHDLGHDDKAMLLKFDHRISSVQSIPHQPHLLLLMFTQGEQLRIFDTRTSKVCTTLSWQQFEKERSLSSYMSPGIHPSGNLVVCGTQKQQKIHLWDLRCVRPNESLSMVNVQDNTVLRVDWIGGEDTIVSMGSDSTVSFLEYKIGEGHLNHSLG